jgi:hypothetical protein
MNRISRHILIGTLLALVLGFAFNLAPVKAADDTFNIYVKHNINGRSLGLEKALPVDVYVNDNYAFTFEFGDSFSAALPAGTYWIDVKLAGTDVTVMSLGSTDIPAGVYVSIAAQLSDGKTPTLRVNVK